MTLHEIRSELERLRESVNYLHSELDRCRPAAPKPTIESVYGKPLTDLKPPAGYAFTGEFRAHAHDREYQLSPETMEAMYPNCHQPRLILRKCKRLVFDIVAEDRTTKDGEWCMGIDKDVIYKPAGSINNAPYVLSDPRVEE